MITEYAERLAESCGFDRSFSRRVRQEVENHLYEAVAADPAGNTIEAERRAIANFGDARAIAAQFAVVWLTEQAKKVGLAAILVIAGVFVAMKTRVAWYGVTQWALSDDARSVGAVVGSIDSCAFWLSVAVGMVGWAYISSGAAPSGRSYGKTLRRFFLLCTLAASALTVSVISDGVLTALRLLETEPSIEFLVPIVSMVTEIACAGILIFHVRNITSRMRDTSALLKT
jgi:hypothetical protein